MPKPVKVQLYHYDCTYFGTKDEQPKLHSIFKNIAKKFIYQLEKTPTTDREHFQIYLNLKVKKRDRELASLLSGMGLKGISCRPASDAGKTALQTYCMKTDTRIAGPWADKPIYRGQDLIKDLRPWQQSVFELLQGNPHPRTIYWYYDELGGAGKSSFSKWLYYHHQILTLTFADAKDLLNLVFKNQGLPAYLFDLSRTKGGKTSMSDIYQALESVKNGYFINSKYETGVACFAIPHVVVFSNHPPDLNCLSIDRWKIVEMSQMSQEK